MKVLHSIYQQIWETQQWPQDWKRSVFIPIPKKGYGLKMFKLLYNCTHVTCYQSMLKILQARLQQNVNRELPDVQVGFREGRGIRDQLPTSIGSLKKQESSRKTSTSGLLTMPKSLTMWITTNCGKFLKQMGITDHLTCLLRNLYAGQEATVKTRYGTTDWFQIGKEVCQDCILSLCLFNFYAEYIMRNAGLEEYKLESRLPEEISITSDMQMIPPLWQKVKKN